MPPANLRAASWYSAGWRIQITSGTPSPCGSSPVAIVTSRDTARATTPSAQPNGLSVKSSPCATAATTGADARVGWVTTSASNSKRGPTSASDRGRPSRSSSTWSAAASMCRRASACNGARRHTPTTGPAPPSSACPTRSAPANTGSLSAGLPEVGAPASCSRAGPPSSTEEARAARNEASAAATGQPRRLARCRCTRLSASRTRSLAAATPGSSISGARVDRHRLPTFRGAEGAPGMA
ncbi:acetyl-coenzyme A synthetase [Mycobacterium tuberculosis]|nr:acetyl-coenzyme A synthetase [Mycobacterium tuberculosis]